MPARRPQSTLRCVPVLILPALLAGALFLCAFRQADGAIQEPVEQLQFLSPLLGTTWTGRFEPPGPSFDHVIRWEPILDGHAIRMVKDVEAADFRMETIYVWDPQAGNVSYLTQTNSGQISTGIVRAENGLIIQEGVNHYDDPVTEYRYTFTVTPDGTLEDRFYHREEGAWIQGHLIVYEPGEKPATCGPPGNR